MITAVLLGLYAIAVAMLAPVLLARYWPTDRAPRLTLMLLHLLSCSFLIAAATTCLAFAVAGVDRLASWNPAIDACADELPISDESPVGAVLGNLALVVVGLLAVRLAYSLLVTFGAARLRRRSHAGLLRMLARPDADLGVLVLDHPEPACYCLPGRGGGIVITSGALHRLSERQLQAVLHHERAHLAARHHVVVALAVAMRRTIPRVRLLAYAERETRRLVELIADDAAARHSGAPTVAAALAVIGVGRLGGASALDGPTAGDSTADGSMAGGSTPDRLMAGGSTLAAGIAADSLAAGGILAIDSSPTVARVRRLIGARRAIRRRAKAASLLAVIATIAVPVALGAAALTTSFRPCPTADSDKPDQTISETVNR